MNRMRLLVAFAVLLALPVEAAEADVKVDLNISNSQPREVEETTAKSIIREYSTAWKALADAVANNRLERVSASFVGTAEDQVRRQVEQQKKNRLSMRLINKGHKVDVIFYSPEGSAMQLRDRAQLERQYLDGGKIVHSETVTQEYLVLMAVTGDRWKVRVLQEQ